MRVNWRFYAIYIIWGRTSFNQCCKIIMWSPRQYIHCPTNIELRKVMLGTYYYRSYYTIIYPYLIVRFIRIIMWIV